MLIVFFAIFVTDLQYLSLRISACSIYVTNKYPCILLKAFSPTVNPAGCFLISPSTHRWAVITSKVNNRRTEFYAFYCSKKFCCRCKIINILLYFTYFAYVKKTTARPLYLSHSLFSLTDAEQDGIACQTCSYHMLIYMCQREASELKFEMFPIDRFCIKPSKIRILPVLRYIQALQWNKAGCSLVSRNKRLSCSGPITQTFISLYFTVQQASMYNKNKIKACNKNII